MSPWYKVYPGEDGRYPRDPPSDSSHPAASWMNEGDGYQGMTGYSNWATKPYTSTNASGGLSHEQHPKSSVSIYPQRHPSSTNADVAMATQQQHQQPISAKNVFGFKPIETQCRFCKKRIVTKISYVRGKTSRFFLKFFLIWGICMPFMFALCLLPLYHKSFLDVLHLCPECRKPLQLVPRPMRNRKRYRYRRR